MATKQALRAMPYAIHSVDSNEVGESCIFLNVGWIRYSLATYDLQVYYVSLKVSKIVSKVENLVFEVAALQKAYVEQICPSCKAPCCQKVSYLFSDKDILFLNLSGRKRKWRRENLKKKGCWFLGPAGCILEPISRPFICHCYLCADLETEMNNHDPKLVTVLREKFRIIDMLRSQMWTE